ncbi:Glucuronide transport protein YihO [Citrobacter freundii]|nr:Glucuronide transport protein YihO [Citrobacter freundii]
MGFFYKLNETRFAFIIEEISQRKKNNIQPDPITNKKNTSAVNV